MKRYEILSIEIKASYEKAFSYISNPKNLPKWATFFDEADDTSAVIGFPDGQITIGLETKVGDSGTIDWYLHMPNDHTGKVYTRLTRLPNGNCLYIFVLNIPPVADEEVEEVLRRQKEITSQELNTLQRILEST